MQWFEIVTQYCKQGWCGLTKNTKTDPPASILSSWLHITKLLVTYYYCVIDLVIPAKAHVVGLHYITLKYNKLDKYVIKYRKETLYTNIGVLK